MQELVCLVSSLSSCVYSREVQLVYIRNLTCPKTTLLLITSSELRIVQGMTQDNNIFSEIHICIPQFSFL